MLHQLLHVAVLLVLLEKTEGFVAKDVPQYDAKQRMALVHLGEESAVLGHDAVRAKA